MRELEKLALISPEADEALRLKLEQRAQELERLRGTKVPHPAMEKDVIMGTSPVSGWAKKMRHRTYGPLRRLLSTPGGKLKALLALGGLGLGAKLYSEGGKSPVSPQQALDIAYQQSAYPAEYGALGKYSSEQEKDAFLEEGLSPYLGGAAGGIGGFLLGKKILQPLIMSQEERFKQKMLNAQKILDRIQRVRKIAPVGSGVIGALLLASLAAKKARDQERERIEAYGDIPAYQHGFNPSDVYTVNDPYVSRYM